MFGSCFLPGTSTRRPFGELLQLLYYYTDLLTHSSICFPVAVAAFVLLR